MPRGPQKGQKFYGRQPMRPFVILARSTTGTWRVKQVMSISHEYAKEKYEHRFDYEVMGVALLEGSGHPIKWISNAPTT